ncbi:MAG: aminotransferase class I/II-fold pyridoxal phosphate-dependent enzyme [Bacteroidia bacterium]|nr:aminotransferase class I/II-fold pyridoxal phosphate-dependent enzyme [Bacteroidia bacterium]MDW8088517.1 aminotransferase class I/II-fold pyridoxal phosphate-dependent enzyme [Bacteroidia bacterium]
MTALAQKHQALNLAQGLLWLPPDPLLLAEAQAAVAQQSLLQYTPPAGSPALREVVAQLSHHLFGVAYDPEKEVTITAGATEAIFAAIMALTQTGDGAIFLEPAYDSYLPAFEMAGVKAQGVRLQLSPHGAEIPWEAVAAALSPHTRLLLLNFPHNPTGRSLREADVAFLAELVERYPQLTLIVDEAYELLHWGAEAPMAPRSLRQHPALRARSVIVGSLGKMTGPTGWRLGYALAPAPLTEALRTAHQFVTFCAPAPLQEAVARYLGSDLRRAAYFVQPLWERRNRLLQLLRKATSLEVLAPEGAYFVLVRPQPPLPEAPLAEWLTQAAGVATIPLGAFYQDGNGEGWLRLCFARPMAMLEEAVERLARVFPAQGPAALALPTGLTSL